MEGTKLRAIYLIIGVAVFPVLLRTAIGCKLDVADIAFLLDVTGKTDDAPKIRYLLGSLVNDTFKIGPDNVSVAIISFQQSVNGIITLDLPQCYPNIWNRIKTIQVHEMSFFGSKTYRALSQARKTFLNATHPKGGRHNTTKIAVVISTDIGQGDRLCTTVTRAISAQQEGIEVYAIGIGNKTRLIELQAIVSEPVSNHAFIVDDFSGLYHLTGNLSEALCAGSRPFAHQINPSSAWYMNYKTACPDPTTTKIGISPGPAVSLESEATTSHAVAISSKNAPITPGPTTEKANGETNETDVSRGNILRLSPSNKDIIIGTSVGASSLVLLAGLGGLVAYLYLRKRRRSVQPNATSDQTPEQEQIKNGDKEETDERKETGL